MRNEEPNEDMRGNISVPLFILTALFYLPYMEILVSRKKSGRIVDFQPCACKMAPNIASTRMITWSKRPCQCELWASVSTMGST